MNFLKPLGLGQMWFNTVHQFEDLSWRIFLVAVSLNFEEVRTFQTSMPNVQNFSVEGSVSNGGKKESYSECRCDEKISIFETLVNLVARKTFFF